MKPLRALILDASLDGALAGRLEKGLRSAGPWTEGTSGRWCPVLPATRVEVGRVGACVREVDPGVVFLCVTGGREREAESFLAAVGDGFRGRRRRPVILAATAMEPGTLCRLIERGASDFVVEPFSPVDLAARLLRIDRELELSPQAEGGLGQGPGQDVGQASCREREAQDRVVPAGLQHLLGCDRGWRSEVEKIPLLARCGASVLILGETGTGKELCARAIHQLGARRERPFTPLNCGAIPAELVENELFGHTCGAYTGAVAAATGIVQSADGGTLFLDEVDALPLGAQVKLLRFLQTKEFRQVGGVRLQRADVRIVAASNVDLGVAVRAGRFRSDLFYRLNVMMLRLPPLRARMEDIPLLARHFMARFSEENGKDIVGLTGAALQRLLMHDWPGNIRELENVMERAVIVAGGPRIEAGDVSLTGGSEPEELTSFKAQKARAVAAFERAYLQQMLVAHDGNISRAARAAQKNRRSFWELIRKHQLRVSRPDSSSDRLVLPP